jgi:hypothetical protein
MKLSAWASTQILLKLEENMGNRGFANPWPSHPASSAVAAWAKDLDQLGGI